ncbi:MAG: 6-pyruvoyl-tetrahydropterin synthase-related protein [Nanoarchaeota archaeon]
MKIKKNQIIYGILLLVFILSVLPWLKEGVPVTDDYRHHASRAWFIKEEFKQLQFSEWVPYMYGGWPFLHFYHPMFYLITSPIALLFNPIVFLKITTILAYAIALFGTFYAAKLLFKDEEVSMIAAVAYFLSSHFLFHATISGALPRLMAIALVPITSTYFIKALEENDKKITAISTILLAILFMMHTSVAVPAFIICFVYTLYNSYLTKTSASFLKGMLILGIAILLSMAWILPMLLEKEYGNFSESEGKISPPYLEQSFRSFGINHNGQTYIRSNYFGYATLVLALISLLFIKKNKTVNFLKLGFITSVFFYFNIFNLLDLVPMLKIALTGSSSYFISMVVFNSVMLAGVGAKSICKKIKKDYLIYILALIIIIELYPGLNTFSYGWSNQKTENFVNPPQLIQAWEFIKQQEGNFVVFSSVGQAAEIYHNKQEFGADWVGCPQCVQKETYKIHNEIWQNFTKGIKNDEQLGYLGVKYYVIPCQYKIENKLAYTNGVVCAYENEKFKSMIESEAKITNINYKLDEVSFKTNSNKPTNVLVKINYFKPHWRAYVNGNETQISQIWPEFMSIDVPVGQNEVLFKYRTNASHIVAWFITFLTIILGTYYVRK